MRNLGGTDRPSGATSGRDASRDHLGEIDRHGAAVTRLAGEHTFRVATADDDATFASLLEEIADVAD